MASLQERVNNRKFYKRVRQDGKWVTIDTRTGKVVDKATRLKHKSENKQRWIQRGKNREKAVGKWISQNIGDRLIDTDEYGGKPHGFLKLKGGNLTKRQSRLKYEKEVANRDTGKDDAEMTAKQQKRALQISKKRDLTNIKVEKPKSEKLKVNKDEGNNAHVRGQQKKDASSTNNETKQQFLERTKNSPAAKAFGNSAAANEKRWQARQNYLDFLARRKAKKNKKK